MEDRFISGMDYKVSRIGLGGHYRAAEDSHYEKTYASFDFEVENRTAIVKKAVENGINYFDTTWRNEVDLLAKVLEVLKTRDQVHVNAMILGAFSGSRVFGQSVEDYFNKYLDIRLSKFPGNRFDSIMVNAIEEEYDPRLCERLIKLLEKRKAEGDFKTFGLSCHNPAHARMVADTFPEFKIIMVPYNFKNRKFEEAFDGYKGDASFIAMKPLVWAEYGIPFCAVNALKDFEKHLGFSSCYDAAAKAIKFILRNPLVTTAICAVNTIEELDILLSAGNGYYTSHDEEVLNKYNSVNTKDKEIYLYISALMFDNLRMNFFGVQNLAKYLEMERPALTVDEKDSHEKIRAYGKILLEIAKDRGYI